MRTNYLVCYDIRDPARLHRVYNYLKGRGRHLQYSVFCYLLTYGELQEMKRNLEMMIDTLRDDVRIYSLPRRFEMIVLGCGDRLPNGVQLFEE
jgi:CRISPR-associated protein Cas2